MLGIFLLPSLIVGVLFYVVVGYGGYLLVKPTTVAQFEIERAWAGDIPSQKHVASCYTNGGCPDLAYAPVLGCAWRQIIVDTTGDSEARREAEASCRAVDPTLVPIVAEAKRNLQSRLTPTRLTAKAAIPPS